MSYSLLLGKFVRKVVKVSGASVGNGRAIAESLVKKGVTKAGLARRAESVEKHLKQLGYQHGKLHGFKCNVTNKEEIISTVNKMAGKLGLINNLVNNAGLGSLSSRNFVGKVSTVTGGASAKIAKALADTLAKKSVTVAGLARIVERLEEHFMQLSNKHGKLDGFKCDATNQEKNVSTGNKIDEKLGSINNLVNNAGLEPLSSGKVVGKVATVTDGASAEIGKTLADTLVEKNVTVESLARRIESLEKHFKQLSNKHGKLHGFQFDDRNQEEIKLTVKKLAGKLGLINILVNISGLGFSTNGDTKITESMTEDPAGADDDKFKTHPELEHQDILLLVLRLISIIKFILFF